MAGDAEKKAVKRRRHALNLYGGFIAGTCVVQVALQLAYLQTPLLAGVWHAAGYAMLAAGYAVCMQGLLSEAYDGTTSEAWLDLFAVVVLTQVGSLFSPWAWMFMIAFPAYAAFLAYNFFMPQLKKAAEANMAEAVHAAAVSVNAQEKADRAERRGGVRGGQPIKRR
jgi:hypothetical protein